MTIKAKTRRIIKLGDSFVVSLPSDFVKKSGLHKGDTVVVSYDGDSLIVLNPNNTLGERRNDAEFKTD